MSMLLACPFCGSSPKLKPPSDLRADVVRVDWEIRCKRCRACVTRPTQQDVVEQWNKRSGVGVVDSKLIAKPHWPKQWEKTLTPHEGHVLRCRDSHWTSQLKQIGIEIKQ